MRIRDHNYLFQWDTKRELEIKEPDAVCVDFARLGETPIRVKIEDGVVKIPDVWLQTSGNQHIYVCYRGGTISDHILQIQRRDKPPEYEANPDDAWSYDDLRAFEDLTACGVITPATDGENAYTDATGNVFVL